MGVKVGVHLPNFAKSVSPQAMAQAAQWASELGFDSVWASDHVVMPRLIASRYPYTADPEHRWIHPPDADWFDPLLALAWAGAAAPNIQLGTSVIVLPMRHPILLAKQIASLDALTSGRLLLGVGVGWMREESEALGAPFDERWARAEEMIDLMRRLWEGNPVDFAGRYFKADGITVRPVPTRRPPVLWGGRTRAALRCVAVHGDGWHPTYRVGSESYGADRALLAALCEAQGRDLSTVTVTVTVGASTILTRETAAWYEDQGATRLVCVPPRDDMRAYRAELERIAGECDLQGRR